MKKKLIYGLFGLLLGFGAVYGGNYLYYHPISVKSVLASYHLLPEPETLTELYFEDHLNLPKKLVLNKSYNFSFTIHNLEYKDMTYSYQISAISNEWTEKITKGEKTLKHDEYATIPVEFKLKNKADRVKIEVNLIDLSQPIHFWMEGEKGA